MPAETFAGLASSNLRKDQASEVLSTEDNEVNPCLQSLTNRSARWASSLRLRAEFTSAAAIEAENSFSAHFFGLLTIGVFRWFASVSILLSKFRMSARTRLRKRLRNRWMWRSPGRIARFCNHPNCNCPADSHDPDLYCSPYCSAADHTDPGSGGCSCGHDRCRPLLSPHRLEDEVKTAIGPV